MFFAASPLMKDKCLVRAGCLVRSLHLYVCYRSWIAQRNPTRTARNSTLSVVRLGKSSTNAPVLPQGTFFSLGYRGATTRSSAVVCSTRSFVLRSEASGMSLSLCFSGNQIDNSRCFRSFDSLSRTYALTATIRRRCCQDSMLLRNATIF